MLCPVSKVAFWPKLFAIQFQRANLAFSGLTGGMTIHSVSQGGLEDEQAKLTFKAAAKFFCFNLKERSASETLLRFGKFNWRYYFLFYTYSRFSFSKDMRSYLIYMLLIFVFLLT